ncbi:hypothetical protein J2Z62_000321 [Mycoplasmoides fastidiosum]|uniref:Uncharacterized protein n=1 Tax=Mycoplasmoides fastidiosum TaxID=92758 RepID=A0ABU0LZ59_9BACT|nr:hypothetical protein [Mycoplasmoides fastidiosum]MDQ0513883.1 hypothetical protein [Mycoplasmoides fastidiosum]UUD37703.1 hypothetical protein NPA10_03995 [Mycoplasmoides fastidiosum]
MYQTPLRKYLWQYNIKKAKMRQSFFRVYEISINGKEKFRSLVVKLRNLVNWGAINDINKIDEMNVICTFQFLNKDLDLNLTFALIETNFDHRITNIWLNINKIKKDWIINQHSYWIIPIALFTSANIKLNDQFLIH